LSARPGENPCSETQGAPLRRTLTLDSQTLRLALKNLGSAGNILAYFASRSVTKKNKVLKLRHHLFVPTTTAKASEDLNKNKIISKN